MFKLTKSVNMNMDERQRTFKKEDLDPQLFLNNIDDPIGENWKRKDTIFVMQGIWIPFTL